MKTTDKKALKILFDTHWTSKGWIDKGDRSITPADLAYAQDAGVMFEPVELQHDEIVACALDARRGIEARAVADAFVTSLTSRCLDHRSALGSFAVLRHFPEHLAPRSNRLCAVCGEYATNRSPHDLNILNFERFKWGGVRHGSPLYAALDLDLFARSAPCKPIADDVEALRRLLQTVRGVPLATTAAELQRHLSPVIRSNKSEREILIGILGLCGILATGEHPGHFPRFVPHAKRELPARRFVDMAYPACWWRGADGLNDKAIEFWFGHLL